MLSTCNYRRIQGAGRLEKPTKVPPNMQDSEKGAWSPWQKQWCER